MQIRYVCTCNPAVQYDAVEQWRKHYDLGKPEWAADRLRYAREHQMSSIRLDKPYVSPNSHSVLTHDPDSLEALNERALALDRQLAQLEHERHEVQRRIDALQRVSVKRERTITHVDVIDRRAGEIVIEGLRKAKPAGKFELITIGKTINGKVKIVEKLYE